MIDRYNVNVLKYDKFDRKNRIREQFFFLFNRDIKNQFEIFNFSNVTLQWRKILNCKIFRI